MIKCQVSSRRRSRAKVAGDEVVISIAPDGRVFFHDLDAVLIEVGLQINPGDEGMHCRLACVRRPGGRKAEESGDGKV